MPGFTVCRSCAFPHTVGCEACKGWGLLDGKPATVAEVGHGAITERCRVCTADHRGVAPEPVSICVENTTPDRAVQVRRAVPRGARR